MSAWWIVGALAAWFVVAALAALLVGAVIGLADRRAAAVSEDAWGVALPAAGRRGGRVRARRRAVPLPPLGVKLAAAAVALEGCGYVSRLYGASGPAADLFSMDAPYSLPRMFVAALFAAAAFAALAGAGTMPGRRAWWTAVGVVAGAISAVKVGSTVHADALAALSEAVGLARAVAVSAALAVGVIGILWFLSRSERRDRLRVLGSLGFYAAAAVGLSAVSSIVAGARGGSSSWAAAATFLEESGEALAGVSVLTAVLIGVAPGLVLPAEWALRRTADEHALDLPDLSPSRSPQQGHS